MNDFKNALYSRGINDVSIQNFYSYDYMSYENSPSMLETHPYSISQSINGNYYDGNTDILLTINDANLNINGNDYDYKADLLYTDKTLGAGFTWGDQLDSSIGINWNGGHDQGSLSMGAVTHLTNAAGINDVTSTASINFEYSPVESDSSTHFSLTSNIEGHGTDYYKKSFAYGYFYSQRTLPSCLITLKVEDSNIAKYSMDSLKESIILQLNTQLDQRGYRWLLNVDSVEVTSFRNFYEFTVAVTQNVRYANFQCSNIAYNYLYFYQLNFYDVALWNNQYSISSSCPANYYFKSTSEYAGQQCSYYYGYCYSY
jgi:hypothetical protein